MRSRLIVLSVLTILLLSSATFFVFYQDKTSNAAASVVRNAIDELQINSENSAKGDEETMVNSGGSRAHILLNSARANSRTIYVNHAINFASTRTAHTKSTRNLYPPPSPLAHYKDFKFLHNEDKCGDLPMYLVILMTSEPGNIEHRTAARAAFGSLNIPGVPITMLFLLGAVKDTAMVRQIKEEIEAFHDIIQGSFGDHFRNASFADLMGLRWVTLFCPQTKYILKTEDRALFDPYQAIDIAHNTFGEIPEFISCLMVRVGSPTFRDPGMQRWYLSKEEYPSDTLEPYCVLSTYFLTPTMARRLDKAALTARRGFSINDVYVSGVLVAEAKATHRNLEPFFSVDPNHWQNWLDSGPKIPCKHTFAPYGGGNMPLVWGISLRMRQHAVEYGLPRYRYLISWG